MEKVRNKEYVAVVALFARYPALRVAFPLLLLLSLFYWLLPVNKRGYRNPPL